MRGGASDDTPISALAARHHELHRRVMRRAIARNLTRRPTGEIVEVFLAGPVTPAALLEDMGRRKR